MVEATRARLADDELHSFLDRLFPTGFAGPDVLCEIAPAGWEQSPLVACFHPSAERVFEEQRAFARRMRELDRLWPSRSVRKRVGGSRARRLTLASVRRTHAPHPVRQAEEATDLIGMCVWDIFADNNVVIAADGRLVDLGTWRGSAAFLDEYLCGLRDSFREGDYLRFYMGTVWIEQRADLTPVYRLIFRRLKAVGADWRCAKAPAPPKGGKRTTPATERAYRRVYGRRPRAWSWT